VSFKRVRLAGALSALLVSHGTWGQNTEADSIRGELTNYSSAVVHAEVTLSDLIGGRMVASSTVSADGRFEFRHVSYGQYRLTVLDADNRPMHEEPISVRESQQSLQIQVTQREEEKPPSGAVSARELLHPPSRSALKAFSAARKFSHAGDHEKAAEQLEKAIRLSPDYADAWTDLAAEHLYLKRHEQALKELAHASEISRPTPVILCNMAFAQYALRRYAEGTRSVREALRLDPASAPAHYLLGSFLVWDPRTRAEGIQHLEAAAGSMPAARGELERARHESAQVANRR